MKADEDTDFFGAEYEAYLHKLAESLYHSLYRSERELSRRMFDPLFLDNGRDN